MPSEQLNWHRFFGLILTDFFTNSPFVVEMEKDLSVKKQLLDVVILRKEEGPFHERLPDGFENLARHNLITFKSHQESLDDWSLKELLGHYVNYRKQVSQTMQELLPEDQFRLYAVSARFPQSLSHQVEGMKMPYTMADFRRDYVKEHLKDLTPEEVKEGLPPEEYLKWLSSEERLKGLPPEERLKGLSSEEKEVLFKLLASQQQKRPTDDSKKE